MVENLKSSIGDVCPSADTLLRAYLHFEALTDHQHQYPCDPPMVVMEIQNNSFNLEGTHHAGPAAALNGLGNVDHILKALTEERIARGFVSSSQSSILYQLL